MKEATKLIGKRMGHGKAADLNGMSRNGHIGDNKRTNKAKTISRKQHCRKKVQNHNSAAEILENNTELYNEYSARFDQN